jgi:phosphoglycolate phosphatase-like HAD superfamily hydrolase
VAVATGGLTRDELAAHGPDLVLDNLTDARPIWDWTARAFA